MKRRPPAAASAAMVRPYAALHKNLAELESVLSQLREADQDDAASAFRRQSICAEMVAGKIDFVKALLAAEKEAHAAGAPPPHILHLSARLRAVEEAFRDCHGGDRSTVLPAEDEDDLLHASTCSCTYECFEEEEMPEPEPEEEEEEDDGRVPEPEDFGTIVEEDLEYSEGSSAIATAEEEEEEEEEEGLVGRCSQCRCRCIGAPGRLCRLIGVVAAMVATAAVAVEVATNLSGAEEFTLVPT